MPHLLHQLMGTGPFPLLAILLLLCVDLHYRVYLYMSSVHTGGSAGSVGNSMDRF